MRITPSLAIITCTLMLLSCANSLTKPISIGNDTYIMTAHGNPSPFGVSSAVDMGKLFEAGSNSCTQQGLRFVLIDRQENAGNTFKLGDGSITYKCEE